MKDEKKIFPLLTGTSIQPPLSRSEIDGMWRVVRAGIHKRKSKTPFYLALGVAATILITAGVLIFMPGEPTSMPNFSVAELHPAEDAPFIEEWEGTPSLIYEGEHDTVKVAFIVDQSITW